MENDPFIDDVPVKSSYFPLQHLSGLTKNLYAFPLGPVQRPAPDQISLEA